MNTSKKQFTAKPTTKSHKNSYKILTFRNHLYYMKSILLEQAALIASLEGSWLAVGKTEGWMFR